MHKKIRIATRRSALALWQANHIKERLIKLYPHLIVELIPMQTTGDKILDKSLAKIGGKGLFVKELENALLEDRADLAVHSMKDMPPELPTDLIISTICQREDPRDVLVTHQHHDFKNLSQGAIVGSSSLRRQSQLLSVRPDLKIIPLRGNVDTRIKKLLAQEFDAIILAAAGVKRLGLIEHISDYFPPETLIPAVAQGALGLQCRKTDTSLQKLLVPLNHEKTHQCVLAERAVTRRLGGSCQTPIAAYACLKNSTLHLQAMVAEPDGSRLIKGSLIGNLKTPEQEGEKLAEQLLKLGADEVLEKLKGDAHP
ncbi:MAG: hydroxymethylbilane synthase [Proteobacteria bacterium]|nr:hydroxymethylbilane synthase [Pseudomonadota bacterium]